MKEVRAVVLDMDGLLIDTEPIWRRSEIEVFAQLGLHLTEEQCMQTMGVPIARIVEMWHRRHPWVGPSTDEITGRIEQSVIDHVKAQGQPMPGVIQTIELIHGAGLSIAIASSSSLALIGAVVDRLGIKRYVRAICTADDEAHGKPHPDVYLTAARRLGVPPEYCLAFEDSPNGVLSAKAAGMICIVVPDPHLADDPRMNEADISLASLEEFTPHLLAHLTSIAESA
ncbi:MAG TPA: hexitol phosphatase HxpB [Chloroflexota bacterium]